MDECGICLQAFVVGESLKVLDCGGLGNDVEVVPENQQKHIFHQECILNWFKKKIECPLCRAQFRPRIVEMLGEAEEDIADDDEIDVDNAYNDQEF